MRRLYDVAYVICSRSILGHIKDIVHINLVSLQGMKIVNELHNLDFCEFLHSSPEWYQKILFKSYKKIDASIVLLDGRMLQFRDFEDMKVEVAPNFYDKELDEKLVEKEESKINLVYLSNIMSNKGVFKFIDTFEKLIQHYDDILSKSFIMQKYNLLITEQPRRDLLIKGN